MYKKIYKSMRILALFALTLAILLTYFVAAGMLVGEKKKEIESEAQILSSLLRQDEAAEVVQSIKATDKHIVLLDERRAVLYDNRADEKLSMADGYYAMKKPTDETYLYYGCTTMELYDGALRLLIPTLFVLFATYIVAVAVSIRLSDKIMEPLNRIDPFDIHYDDAYPEIAPLLRRLVAQRREIQRQADRVERQNLRFRAIGEQMTNGLVLLGRSRKIIMVNAAALGAFGALESDVLGQNFIQLCRDGQLCQSMEKAWEGHRYQTERVLDGKPYQLYCSPILQEDVVTGVLLMLFDISEKREAEQMRREFTANVSHELKSPLTSVLGYAQLINGGIAKAEEVPLFAGKIEKEATRLLNLIDDIIELSKLDEMQEAPQKTEVSLEGVIIEVMDSLADKAEKRGISMSFTGEDTLVEGNMRQISELVYNLCDNAIKYNKENGSVHITLSDKTLSVSDTGIGIAPQYTERIFERFFRVDKMHSRSAGGTGLGLSIVKHIVSCHNAQISVESKPGEGSCFTVKFEK